MQSARERQSQRFGGRPQYRYARWAPPPEPKPEPKLDLSDKNFPSLSNTTPVQATGTQSQSFGTSFSTKVKVLAEVEKLQDLKSQRERQATQQERDALKGVYTERFRAGRLSTARLEEPEEPSWRAYQEEDEEDEEDGWMEVRHSKAHRATQEKSMRELDEDYRAKELDEEEAEWNGELFESSHRHDHYAT